MNTPADSACFWIDRGYWPVPVPFRTKHPVLDGWPQLRITKENVDQYFNGTQKNIGVLLGDQYNSSDVDLDSHEAILAADEQLPPTGIIFGRQSKPRSHWLYRTDPAVKTRMFEDPLVDKDDKQQAERAMLLELRGRKQDGGVGLQTIVPSSVHPSGEPIRFARGFDREAANVEAKVLVKAVSHLAATALLARYWPKDGTRHQAFLALAGILARERWDTEETLRIHRGIYRVLWPRNPDFAACASEVETTVAKAANDAPTTAYQTLSRLMNTVALKKALEWLSIGIPPSRFGNHTYEQSDTTFAGLNLVPYPEPIGEAAYIGIAGRFVRAVEPHTEADPSFVLLQFLAYAGNAFGRDAHVYVSGDIHYANLFVCGVGPTATGRKGSAKAPVETFFRGVDDDWIKNATSGLSSGEGLIYAVRDAIYKRAKANKKGEPTTYREVCVDEGIKDKRLIVRQPELASALRVMKRDGNTLSATLRDAWDTGFLNTMVKNSPAKATNAHITIIGNITAEELLVCLEGEIDNGLSNRFLWCCSRRSKLLPEGGLYFDNLEQFRETQKDFNRIHYKIKGRVVRDAEANEMWGNNAAPDRGVYRELTREKYGMWGKVTSRGAVQVLRMALIYALLDGSQEISRHHLDAALEVWRYCDESARFIFGDRLGNPTADAILQALKEKPAGLTRRVH